MDVTKSRNIGEVGKVVGLTWRSRDGCVTNRTKYSPYISTQINPRPASADPPSSPPHYSAGHVTSHITHCTNQIGVYSSILVEVHGIGLWRIGSSTPLLLCALELSALPRPSRTPAWSSRMANLTRMASPCRLSTVTQAHTQQSTTFPLTLLAATTLR